MSAPKRGKGFRRTAALLQSRIKSVGSTRGFAVARLLTHWPEIVGADIARAARPVDVKYSKGGFGATLTLLVKGAEAPMIEMQKERIRTTVNACYGYNAIQKIRISQTAAIGFGAGVEANEAAAPTVSDDTLALASDTASCVKDGELRKALEDLGARVLSHHKQK
ncbi:MAG: DUF721 domain-containing protein [Pseudomonadota bacterium]